MQKVLELYKKEGETPLETIEGFKKENPEYSEQKMTYAGRLDPMAEGVLIVLVGEECKNKDKYLGLDKEYEFEILWGFETDTYDILGIPQMTFLHSRECKNVECENSETSEMTFQHSCECTNEKCKKCEERGSCNNQKNSFLYLFPKNHQNDSSKFRTRRRENFLIYRDTLRNFLKVGVEILVKNLISFWETVLHSAECKNEFLEELGGLKGKFMQKYPPYSSMTVEGKQLFQWAREGKLDEIEIPEREVEVYDVEFLGDREIDGEELLKNIQERVGKVKGDFRQKEILEKWEKILSKNREVHFPISKVKIKCSSGTYVRGIANELGKKLRVGAIAFSIKRTKVFKVRVNRFVSQ